MKRYLLILLTIIAWFTLLLEFYYLFVGLDKDMFVLWMTIFSQELNEKIFAIWARIFYHFMAVCLATDVLVRELSILEDSKEKKLDREAIQSLNNLPVTIISVQDGASK